MSFTRKAGTAEALQPAPGHTGDKRSSCCAAMGGAQVLKFEEKSLHNQKYKCVLRHAHLKKAQRQLHECIVLFLSSVGYVQSVTTETQVTVIRGRFLTLGEKSAHGCSVTPAVILTRAWRGRGAQSGGLAETWRDHGGGAGLYWGLAESW